MQCSLDKKMDPSLMLEKVLKKAVCSQPQDKLSDCSMDKATSKNIVDEHYLANMLHTFCTTGKLSVLAMTYQRLGEKKIFSLSQQRDSFGLYPVDKIPPELMTPLQPKISSDPISTNKPSDLIHSFIAVLRHAKQDDECRTLNEMVMETDPDASASQPKYCLRFSTKTARHAHGKPLRVIYTLPRMDCIENGYFQLIWRYSGEDEVHYGQQRMMRDQLLSYLISDQTFLDEEAFLKQGQSNRVLRDKPYDALRGAVTLNTDELPNHCICHILFAAAFDKHKMKRKVVLSSEGILISNTPVSNVKCGFTVAGEYFEHRNAALEGKVFDSLQDFFSFARLHAENNC